MRVSVDSNDRGYAAWSEGAAEGFVWEATLDGVPVDCCVTADDEAGEVVVHARYPDGSFVADPADPLADVLSVRRGKVDLRRVQVKA